MLQKKSLTLLFTGSFFKSSMKPKVLYVTQELDPFLPQSSLSAVCRLISQLVQATGKDVRIFMPKYGSINERKHQLHEVIRLSGLNISVNRVNHGLVIKVSSIQKAKIQVYFIDNPLYFDSRFVAHNQDGSFMSNNDERSLFFVKGVLETIKKLGWRPDVIHCHGWMSAALPVYLRTLHKDNPFFSNIKLVYTAFPYDLDTQLSLEYLDKITVDGLPEEVLVGSTPPSIANLQKLACSYADACVVVQGENHENEDLTAYVKNLNKPYLIHPEQVQEEIILDYASLYGSIIENWNE
jgi:starch synthase